MSRMVPNIGANWSPTGESGDVGKDGSDEKMGGQRAPFVVEAIRQEGPRSPRCYLRPLYSNPDAEFEPKQRSGSQSSAELYLDKLSTTLIFGRTRDNGSPSLDRARPEPLGTPKETVPSSLARDIGIPRRRKSYSVLQGSATTM